MKNYSLAIPTYKRYDELQRLLATIPLDVSVHISDNGATLPANFQQEHSNATVCKISPPIFMFKNWNFAIKMSTEKWVAIPSDDDIYFKDSFEIIEKYLEKYAEADVIIFGHNNVDENYKKIGEWQPLLLEEFSAPDGFERFKYGVSARMPSIFFKHSLLIKLGYFDTHFQLTAADSDLVQRALMVGNSVFVPEIVSGYRVWQSGATHNTISTLAWMREIDYWGSKIEKLLMDIPKYKNEASSIRAELYASNLLAGVVQTRRSGGYRSAWNHILHCKYPLRAKMKTQLRLLFWLMRP